MKFTNRHNLPAPVVRAIQWNDRPDFDEKTISVTRLLKPAQAVALEKIHSEEIVEDVADHLWRLLGQAVHYIIEKGSIAGDVAETRLTVNIMGWVISGQFDLLEQDGTLSDFKVTSVWSYLLGDKPEWVAQANIYSYIARKNGLNVNKLQIVAILRDWQSSKAGKAEDEDYPLAPLKVIPVEMWSDDKIEAFLMGRLGAHIAATKNPAAAPCSPEERWERPSTWAIMERGKRGAHKVLRSHADAEAYMGNLQKAGMKGFSVEFRPGSSRRCYGRFCLAAPWCEQKKAMDRAKSGAVGVKAA